MNDAERAYVAFLRRKLDGARREAKAQRLRADCLERAARNERLRWRTTAVAYGLTHEELMVRLMDLANAAAKATDGRG